MKSNYIKQSFISLLTFCSLASSQTTPVVHFTIDAARDAKPISRYIYGINQLHNIVDGLTGDWSNATFTRFGGNRMTAYNWVNSASNAGKDMDFQSDNYLVDGPMFKGREETPGGAAIAILDAAASHNAATLLTVPINGYVAADKRGDGNVKKSGQDYLLTRFKVEVPRKGSPFTLTPDPNTPVVYQDEFVNWVTKKFPRGFTDSQTPIWFTLDNEPDIWSETHPEVHPQGTTYSELVLKSIAYAEAIKDVAPDTLVFAPGNYGWGGFIHLQLPGNELGDFQDYFLEQMAMAEVVFGRRLIDVLDVHWYPEATGDGQRISLNENAPNSTGVIEARVQAPRSLWDPTYTETSWITKASTHGPIELLPRLKRKIEQNYPGTKLAITEYDYGGGRNISGGIAEADVLGIFGREGVFAAALWPTRNIPFTGAGFDMFRNFDGKNGAFGDTSIHAESDNYVDSSIYASLDSTDHNRMVIVAINKTDHSLNAAIDIANAAAF